MGHIQVATIPVDFNIFYYTLLQKKVTFNLSISPGAPRSLTLTCGLDDFVKRSWE